MVLLLAGKKKRKNEDQQWDLHCAEELNGVIWLQTPWLSSNLDKAICGSSLSLFLCFNILFYWCLYCHIERTATSGAWSCCGKGFWFIKHITAMMRATICHTLAPSYRSMTLLLHSLYKYLVFKEKSQHVHLQLVYQWADLSMILSIWKEQLLSESNFLLPICQFPLGWLCSNWNYHPDKDITHGTSSMYSVFPEVLLCFLWINMDNFINKTAAWFREI